MADESEKRFHAIMDKLFHAPPKSKSKAPTTNSTSLSGVQLSRGKKRPHIAVMEPKSRGGVAEELQNTSGGTVQAPLCRPWDRGDFLRRLATFKSIKWFAKPEVVNAVNCARRGWVNVDMDTIACEACGARLLFSTPSSWAQYQVEKAALVFSLKLNNGHKLLCPWVDNACDEMIAQFPPTPAVDLVDNYKKRCGALLQLVSLPVISSSAIDYMRSPQLEHFLNESSTVEYGNKAADASITKYLGNECESLFSVLYYQPLQAQKLISLCGWEPRLLPYIVDFKDQEDQSTRDGYLSDPSHVVSNGRTPSISVYSSGTAENMGANEDPTTSSVQYDPTSVVLDCKLCGASVGLWAFCTTPRPVEFIRLIGCSEINGEKSVSGNENPVENRECTTGTDTTGTKSSNGLLNLTIAGGPPPAEQNFRPTISLPVVGQNLRARLYFEFESRDDQYFRALRQGDKDHSSNTLSRQGFQPEDMGLIQGKRHEDAHCNSTSTDLLPCLRSDISEPVEAIRGADICGNEIPETGEPDCNMGNPLEDANRVIQSSGTVDKLSENATSVEPVDPASGDLCCSQVGSTSTTTLGGQVSTGNGETILNNTSLTDVAVNGYLQQTPGSGTLCGKQGDSQNDHGVLVMMQPVYNNANPCCLGKDLKQLSAGKSMDFDPIRQHRYFCPWIASIGTSSPGWKQSLNALQRQTEPSFPLSRNEPSSSLIEVDDPIGSVKKLFTPPSAKRLKRAHGSS